MTDVLTIQQIVAKTLSLKPALATQFDNGKAATLCTTDLFEAVLVNGEVLPLHLVDGRYGAVYVRVSTERQRAKDTGEEEADHGSKVPSGVQDGFSEPDQVERGILHFIEQRQAFRIFSDAALSGGLPPNDPKLMQRAWDMKADTYHQVFEKVFLEAALKRYSDAEREAMRQHMEQAVANVRATGAIHTAEIRPGKRRGRARKKHGFRPALTILLQQLPAIHTVAVTDSSRLARNVAVFSEIAYLLLRNHVMVKGLVENMNWMNGSGFGDEVARFFISKMAEMRLQEVCMNSLRGILQMLETGRPHGTIPSWLIRTKDGYTELRPDRVAAMERMISLYLDSSVVRGDGGWNAVALAMTQEKIPGPTGGRWLQATVRDALRSPAIAGYQVMFGKRWKVFPPLVDETTFERIQARVKDRAKRYTVTTPHNPEGYLATGLLRCWCGETLNYRHHSTGVSQYTCSAHQTARAQPGARHLTLNRENVDAFFNGLFEHHPRVMLDALRNTQAHDDLSRRIAALEERAQALRERKRAEEPLARRTAHDRLNGIVDEQNPIYGELLGKAVEALLIGFTDQEREIERQIKQEQFRLDTMIPTEQIGSLEERMSAWTRLTTLQKNDLLRTFFYDFRIYGYPPDEYLLPRLRTATERMLAPIPIRYPKRYTVRRLPTADEWIAGLFDGEVCGEADGV